MSSQTATISLTRRLAPEDVRPKAYVAILWMVGQHIPNCAESAEVVNSLWLPPDDATPLKVIDVCLPFVVVRDWNRAVRTLDTRQCRLGELDPAFARRVRRLMRDRVKSKGRRGRRKSG